jgi:hypothetical protein
MLTLFGTKYVLDKKKEFVQDFSERLSFFQIERENDGKMLLSPKSGVSEHDRALEFLNITQNLNKAKVNYIISRDGKFHICYIQN